MTASYVLKLDVTSGANADGESANHAIVAMLSGSAFVNGEELTLTLAGNSAKFSNGSNTYIAVTNTYGIVIISFTNTVEESVMVMVTDSSKTLTQSATSTFVAASLK